MMLSKNKNKSIRTAPMPNYGLATVRGPRVPARKLNRKKSRKGAVVSPQKLPTIVEETEIELLYSMMPWSSMDCVAMNCEMVEIGPDKDSVLARVSIVDYTGNALLDTLVHVKEKLTAHTTFVSVIKPKDLTGSPTPSAMDFEACREKVATLLKGKILVGHGLEKEFKVLHVEHPSDLIRDTATYQPYMHKRVSFVHTGFGDSECESSTLFYFQRRSLADLVHEYCRDDAGHDDYHSNNKNYQYDKGLPLSKKQIHSSPSSSLDNARAAMNLYKLQRNAWDAHVEKQPQQQPQQQQQQQPPNCRSNQLQFETQQRPMTFTCAPTKKSLVPEHYTHFARIRQQQQQKRQHAFAGLQQRQRRHWVSSNKDVVPTSEGNIVRMPKNKRSLVLGCFAAETGFRSQRREHSYSRLEI